MITVRCSSGTYVRTLAHNIGERLQLGAHLAALRRTAVGHFQLSGALTIEKLEALARDERLAEVIISPADTIAHLPAIRLGSFDSRLVANGRMIELREDVEGSHIRLLDAAGNLIAVGVIDETQRAIRPRVVLSAV